MSFAVTKETILKIAPKAKPSIVAAITPYIKEYAPKYNVNTPKRLSAFIAQAAHETDSFRSLEEYHSGANYEGRKDLGNVVAGDGKRFKGRGIFMYTGRTNYRSLSKKIFGDENRLLANPELLLQPKYAVLSAFIYWNERNLNALADKGDTTGITKKINGGTNGLEDRKHYYDIAQQFIKDNPITTIIGITLGAGALAYLATGNKFPLS